MYHGLILSQSKRWAEFRLVLGCLQMFGAVFSLTLFLWLGVHRLALGAMIVTGVLTAASFFLFGARQRFAFPAAERGGHQGNPGDCENSIRGAAFEVRSKDRGGSAHGGRGDLRFVRAGGRFTRIP
jgi:hypothetical protein